MNKDIKILIVDDSHFDRNLISNVLQKKGFQVSNVDSGKKCFDELSTSKPDIILLDVMMPEISGKEVLQWIRQKYNSVELPVIMVTAKSDASDVVEFLFLGANDYIIKPVDFEIALMRIMTHLKIGILSKEMARLKEMEAVNAMITTYNHELNNCLAIALGHSQSFIKNNDTVFLEKLNDTLWRIVDIVKKIDGVTKLDNLSYEDYTNSAKMIKVK